MGLLALIVLLVPLLVSAQPGYHRPGYGSQGGYRPAFGPGYNPYSDDYHPGFRFNNECGSEILTCVNENDCEKVLDTDGRKDGHACPPYYKYDEILKYCVNVDIGEDHDQLDAVEICQSQGAELLHIENLKEFQAIADAHENGDAIFMDPAEDYFLDAYYDDKREVWVRRSNGQRIIWEQIFPDLDTTVVDPLRNIQVVREIDTTKRCLTIEYDVTFEERLKVVKVECTDDGPEIACKLGYFTNTCQKNSAHMCCFSPTSNFYIKNHMAGPGSALSEAEANCFMEVDGANGPEIMTCEEVLLELDPPSDTPTVLVPYRVGSSFFYVADDDCMGKGNRKAVVSTRKVHQFIERYMTIANLETADTYTNLIIGLIYKGPIHKLVWQNGLPYDYYNETYWNGGRPHYEHLGDTATPICGNYLPGPLTYQYRWELTEECTNADPIFNICELPIRVTDLMPTSQKVDCGMRHRRGVLARSAYASGHELQALYGEFPWHAAIYRVRHHVGLVHTFVCSGVLIDKEFVLAPAHCVVGPSKAYSIVLGEYAVGGGPSALMRRVMGVSDILVYPGFESTNPLFHDIALVQLSSAVDIDKYPQIGIACLPFPDILIRNTGAWDCFTVGWNGKGGALQKVESNIMPTRHCRIHTRPYQEFMRHVLKNQYGYGNSGYDKAHGFHLVTYPKHFYFNRRQPDLICTTPHESEACVDDPAAVLVCRPAPLHPDTIFGYANRGFSHAGYRKTSARIINAYGKFRFDSDKWYVMGLSHSLSPCGGSSGQAYTRGYKNLPKKTLQVFTPVHEYLSFIHAHQDTKVSSTSA